MAKEELRVAADSNEDVVISRNSLQTSAICDKLPKTLTICVTHVFIQEKILLTTAAQQR